MLNPLDVAMLKSFPFLGMMPFVCAGRGLRLIFWSFSSARITSNGLLVFRFISSLRSAASAPVLPSQLVCPPSHALAGRRNFLGIETNNPIMFLSQFVEANIVVACRSVHFVDA